MKDTEPLTAEESQAIDAIHDAFYDRAGHLFDLWATLESKMAMGLVPTLDQGTLEKALIEADAALSAVHAIDGPGEGPDIMALITRISGAHNALLLATLTHCQPVAHDGHTLQ